VRRDPKRPWKYVRSERFVVGGRCARIGLSRRRSRVRVPSLPLENPPAHGGFSSPAGELGELKSVRLARRGLLVFRLQDVLPERRSHGIATLLNHAAEQEVRASGWDSISLSVSKDGNPAARRLYDRLGYVEAGVDPVQVSGTIMLRGRPFEVDDTLVYLKKPL
jgi:GNAT superfamily N-acetyltransferase